MDIDKILIDICYTKHTQGKLVLNPWRTRKIEACCPMIREYLMTRYEDADSLQEALVRTRYHIDVRPTCPVCGKKVKFVGKGDSLYRKHCSVRCSSLDKEVQRKLKSTNIQKYGTEAPLSSITIREKSKRTCLERYGVEYSFQSENNKAKSKETLIRKYGVDNAMKSAEVQAKYRETCTRKYGADNPSKNPSIMSKGISTRINNNTWSTSAPEKRLYSYIKEKFPDVKREHVDKARYPWHCDFYIPSLDLFIEYNGHWTHGKHPYSIYDIEDQKIEDQKIVEEWKARYKDGEHPMYLHAIEIWTVKDVMKRQTARRNNLYYREFWNLTEAMQFIDTL